MGQSNNSLCLKVIDTEWKMLLKSMAIEKAIHHQHEKKTHQHIK